MKTYIKRSRCLDLVLVAILLAVVFVVPARSAPEQSNKPDFTLKDQNGADVSLSALRGKIVVLEWVNPDCPFTKRHYSEEKQTTVKLVDQYSSKPVVFLSINSTHYFDQQKNKEWYGKLGLKHKVLDDNSGEVGREFKAKSTPHVYVIDPQGSVVYQGAIDNDPYGDKPESEIRNYINVVVDDLLAGRKVSVSNTQPYGCSVKYSK